MTIVHVVNGDSTATTLAEAELPGDIVVWADALDSGPLPAHAADDAGAAAFRAARAAFWAARVGGDAAAHEARLAGWDRGVDDAAAGADELVLWYEHDLFDQLALVRLLARLGRTPPRAQVTLVSIDRHDDVPDFRGLGQLEAYQLAALWPRRTPVAKEALDEAAAAWLAVTAPDPRAVHHLAKRTRVLPFLGFALERHLEELPDAATGLTRSEAWMVRAVEGGVASLAGLVAALPAGDRYVVTDQNVRHAVATLAAAGVLAVEAPLADALAGRAPIGKALAAAAHVHAGPLAKDVLSGKVDRVARAGLDDWRGGVRLAGTGPMWRWDLGARRVVWK